jgi:hypothetical protein
VFLLVWGVVCFQRYQGEKGMSRIVHRDAYYVFHFQNILPNAIVMTLGMFSSDESTFLSYESDIATPINLLIC